MNAYDWICLTLLLVSLAVMVAAALYQTHGRANPRRRPPGCLTTTEQGVGGPLERRARSRAVAS